MNMKYSIHRFLLVVNQFFRVMARMLDSDGRLGKRDRPELFGQEAFNVDSFTQLVFLLSLGILL